MNDKVRYLYSVEGYQLKNKNSLESQEILAKSLESRAEAMAILIAAATSGKWNNLEIHSRTIL